MSSASGGGPTLSLVAALDLDRLIGRADGRLPWHLPRDLAHFKRLTLGKTLLMGRKTWDSLGRPLPGRDNWVLSRDPAFAPVGARRFESLDDALAAHPHGELMVIGGAELYRQTLARAQRLYLTEVGARLPAQPGDVHFPAFERGELRETLLEEHTPDERHAHPFRFVLLERA